MGTALDGYGYAGVAAIFFGLQYVPVKKYDVYDGTTFQWFMCSGILLVGCMMAIFTGNTLETGEIEARVDLLCMMGGAFWALSNFIVLPLVKLLGIGLGFALYHFVNLVVGYVVGRLGAFGLKKMVCSWVLISGPSPDLSLTICDAGAVLLLVSFVILVFVEGGDAGTTTVPLGPAISGDVSDEYRQRYRQWRIGGAESTAVSVRDLLESSAGVRGRGSVRHFNFGVFSFLEQDARQRPCAAAETEEVEMRLPPSFASAPATLQTLSLVDEADAAPARRVGAAGEKLLGVALAIVGGSLCGVNNVPSSVYALKHTDMAPTGAVLSQVLGIWVTSTLIYLCYASVARLSGWPVPHSVIRPAFLSGCIWTLGWGAMVMGIKDLGYSVGYTLDAVGPVAVSSLVSILVYKEIQGAKQLALFFAGFSLQLIGVSLIAAFGS